ncbi:MAG: small multi-drug export protein [Oscillospiraceae bacterium]|jgi:uncharacterized membrane protein|nr:small multi-drug export protein [Oscillospiraceae bacterium]
MVESLVNYFQLSCSPVVIVFLISMLPILELRGGLIAAFLLKLDWQTALFASFIGSMVPIPFILLFIKKIFLLMKKTKFKKIAEKLEFKANKKSESMLKYEYWGLMIFVAIPLPGTGAWTGALIAALLNMKPIKAMIFVSLGSFIAGILIMLASYGTFGLIFS